MERNFIIAAAIFGFFAVALGAFGAHSLESYFDDHPDREDNYHTATLYQMFHVAGLIGVAFAASQWSDNLLSWAGYLFIVGILVFSGSLYLLSMTGVRWLGAITPIGGVAFLGGWLCLAIAAWRA